MESKVEIREYFIVSKVIVGFNFIQNTDVNLDFFVRYQHVISTTVAQTAHLKSPFSILPIPFSLSIIERVTVIGYSVCLSKLISMSTDCPLETRLWVDKLFDRFGCPWQRNGVQPVIGDDVNHICGSCFGWCFIYNLRIFVIMFQVLAHI